MVYRDPVDRSVSIRLGQPPKVKATRLFVDGALVVLPEPNPHF